MIYPKRAALSRHSIPKLLGTYEQELHGVIEVISHRRYEMVIDIGSAEGYYAVGLARMLGTKVLAYDPEPDERRYCEEAARLNGVSSMVELKGLFWRSDIASLRDVRVLCICDCEGFEAHLFNEESTPGTAGWDLLIELHGDAEGRLMNLPWPHRMTTIHSVPRSARFKELEGLGDQAKLLSEYRGSPQTWLWCESLVQQ
jgi:hypothetical protein